MSDCSSDGADGLQRDDRATSSTKGFECLNCYKSFARSDLLRRHMAREARAAKHPSFHRQKSCSECARSKARCDLAVPACTRCLARGRMCTYSAHTGNPNVHKLLRRASMQHDSSISSSGNSDDGSVAGMWTPSLTDDSLSNISEDPFHVAVSQQQPQQHTSSGGGGGTFLSMAHIHQQTPYMMATMPLAITASTDVSKYRHEAKQRGQFAFVAADVLWALQAGAASHTQTFNGLTPSTAPPAFFAAETDP